MSLIRLTVDGTRFQSALAKFSAFQNKSGQQILFEQAKLFVRDVIAITPPAQGKANAEAKRRGETAIAADLARIFTSGSQDFIRRFIEFNGGPELKEDFGHRNAAALGFVYTRALKRGEMEQWHQDRRRKDGRVRHIGGGSGTNKESAYRMTTGLRKADLRALDVGLVDKSSYAWFKRETQKRVGLLAGGWNAAAQKLNYRAPAWVRRHGTDRGLVEITMGNGVFVIRVTNAVRFVENVRGLQGRVQRALNYRAKQMEKQLPALEAKAAKRAGFK